ncbi:hypothetical protein [Nonomuraea typhae]|uniref:hypothetical protein n=1 Tax=Nonomuraea typhae TaxID=2603600 RepID=UPI0012F80568|nr:hypothetical protein [Nonomuraea typhae]
MIKKIATGFLAVAATTALALSLPTAAGASTASSSDYDYSDFWGPVFAKHHLAKSQGWVGVDWDHDQESNTVRVSGRLYDLDPRSYDEGGKCAYVKFQTSDFDYDWSTVYTKKYCGYPGYKKYSFSEDDVYSLRVKVCQVGPYGNHVSKCGPWEYLYTAESE